MTQRYYLDTSIWLDFFEYRDEPNLPKGRWAQELLNKIIKTDAKIIYSDHTLTELEMAGYPSYEINKLLKSIEQVLIFVESTDKQIGKARDLSLKRNIPKGDALHALIARDNQTILVTLDRHFQKIIDIIKPTRPQDII